MMGYNQKLVFSFSTTILRNSLLDLSAFLENISAVPCGFCGHFQVSDSIIFRCENIQSNLTQNLNHFKAFSSPQPMRDLQLEYKGGENRVGSSLRKGISGRTKIFLIGAYILVLSLYTISWTAFGTLDIPRQGCKYCPITVS